VTSQRVALFMPEWEDPRRGDGRGLPAGAAIG